MNISIKNISVKNIKNFLGHEQEPLVQCDVCYQGKKVAFYSQDSWGGEDRLDFDYNLPFEKRKELKNIFEKSAKEYIQERIDKGEKVEFYAEHKEWYNATTFILDIIELNDIAKYYKKVEKQGKDNLLAYMKDELTMGYVSWKGNQIYTKDYVMKQCKIKKEQVRYFIQSENNFVIA